MRKEYQTLVEQERQQLPFRIAVVRIAANTPGALATARTITERARQGADFMQLSRTHSTSDDVRSSGGLLERTTPSELPKELQRASLLLDVGEVSAPVKSNNDWVVLKVVERDESALPAYEDAADQLRQRVQLKKMESARAAWLKTLRRQHHVDVRL